MEKKPNFFIIGAPKCGTTTLSACLAEHPSVFMSNPKELDFFDRDIAHGYRDNIKQYKRFFEGVKDHHTAIGEASTGYLRSRFAVADILEYSAHARFIVGLRNPVDLAISWHGQGVTDGWEVEKDFEQAWRLQNVRRSRQRVPVFCPSPERLLYGEVCKLGAQMERLYSQVPRNRVFVYTLDEMRVDPRGLWTRLLDFVGAPDDNRSSFPLLNEAKDIPSWLSLTTRLVYLAKRKLGVSQFGLGIMKSLNRGLAHRRSVSVPDELYKEMTEFFRDDIQLLSELIGRDLSTGWSRPVSVQPGNSRLTAKLSPKD